jgi:choline kinase
MRAVILAAGIGSRLGRPYPKSLSKLPDGTSIMERQIAALRGSGIKEIIVVVGFKKEFIMEAFPSAYYKYNPFYYITNTSKSLLAAVADIDDDVIWMNGDVVFDEGILHEIMNIDKSVICVNNEKCHEEEIKYTVNEKGLIDKISKVIPVGEAKGEAIGINKVLKKDLQTFRECLDKCDDNDYFERGIEYMVEAGGEFLPYDISKYKCIEIDMQEDWDNMLSLFQYRK